MAQVSQITRIFIYRGERRDRREIINRKSKITKPPVSLHPEHSRRAEFCLLSSEFCFFPFDFCLAYKYYIFKGLIYHRTQNFNESPYIVPHLLRLIISSKEWFRE
jgi:hypothetical protein